MRKMRASELEIERNRMKLNGIEIEILCWLMLAFYIHTHTPTNSPPPSNKFEFEIYLIHFMYEWDGKLWTREREIRNTKGVLYHLASVWIVHTSFGFSLNAPLNEIPFYLLPMYFINPLRLDFLCNFNCILSLTFIYLNHLILKMVAGPGEYRRVGGGAFPVGHHFIRYWHNGIPANKYWYFLNKAN